MPKSHEQGSHRGLNAAADGAFGRFGRMFPDLIGPEYHPDNLWELAQTMIKVDDGQFFNAGDDDENLLIPAGYTYFGQFVDHDLTLDKTSVGEQEKDPVAVENFRTAALDLDNVYGNGPGSSVALYDQATFKLKLGEQSVKPSKPGTVQTIHDHLRDQSGVAQIGDPRNDENVIVAQLHQSFVRFHNKVMDTPALMVGVTDKGDAFRRAARLTRWHYQWVVVHDFLRRITHPAIYQDIAGNPAHPRLRYYPKSPETARYPYMPIEFAAAAYRFGHSMVRPSYALNAIVGTDQPPRASLKRVPIFNAIPKPGLDDLRGFRPIPAQWGIDWGYFFKFGDGNHGAAPGKQQGKGTLQPAYRIDTLLVEPLRLLPNPDLINRPNQRERSLAFLNLLRGSMLRLPTAEQVASRMMMPVGGIARFPLMDAVNIWSAGSRRAKPHGAPSGDAALDALRAKRAALRPHFEGATPLWYYILREAEWYATWDEGDSATLEEDARGKKDMLGGHHLGPMGSVVVLETFLALLNADTSSFVHQAGWRPMAPIASAGADFLLEDMVRWALG